ncbi:alpha/beta hydrolase fold domain-containing protein [Salsipaludibacter albus]|uniref:alpha/beta hydrolase fold domain-containing protein n=1 Tax=Salsipaludibacter albus TaxID=2849650 RepID=UPI0023677BA8|nr:alpha/beta hydrolase fold domain-containing protein [Salsipaludibacter albus]MBY5160926.1 serine hydrolase [Salsipaludibacter albus]
MRPGLRVLARLDRLRGRPDEWDDRRRDLLRGGRVPPGPVGDLLVRPWVEAVFGTPHRDARVEEVEVPGAAGPIPARVHRPDVLPEDAPLVVHLHGGGWTFSGAVQYDWWCSQVAVGLGAVVVSVDHRQAPEHPAPAAVDDAVAATTWLLDHASEGFGATGLAAVTGDSAGANLATLVALDRRDAGDDRLRAQWLVCPIVDLACSAPSFDTLVDALFLDRAELDATIAGYLDGLPADDPRVSPWHVDDLSGVAPTLVQVAEHDLLVDDGVRWAARLAEAGVAVELTRWVDQPHVFTLVPGVAPAARAALAEGVAFLAAWLDADATGPPTRVPEGRRDDERHRVGRISRSRHPDVPDEWIHGDVQDGFGPVADVFVRNFADRDEVGAALHVVQDGRVVVDLWGGHADPERTRPWRPDTMVPVWSTTKGMAMMTLAVAHSRGWLDFDETVATSWPEFAAEGKDRVTVRELLGHRAGLAVLDEPLDWEVLADPDDLAARLGAQAPLWEPGTRQGYHAVTLGFYEGELLRRVDPAGRSVGTFFAEEIAAPLGGLDFLIGVPDDLPDDRLATFLDAPIARGLFHLRDMEWRLLAGLMRPGSLTAQAFLVMPFSMQEMGRVINDRDILRLELPAFGGVGSARALGTAYGEFATGGARLGLEPATLEAIAEPVTDSVPGGKDIVLGFDLSFALGFGRPSSSFVLGSSDRSYGFAGAGGSFGFADPDLGLGYGYVMNQMGFGNPTDPREVALRNALYGCLGERPQT